jgi:hypothetical protein
MSIGLWDYVFSSVMSLTSFVIHKLSVSVFFVLRKSYLEYGEYNGNLYGTAMDEVKSIITAGYVGILCPKAQV